MNALALDDQVLMAFADGELAERQAEPVRSAADAYQSVAERVAVFKVSAQLLRAASQQVLQQPVPQHLYDALLKLGR